MVQGTLLQWCKMELLKSLGVIMATTITEFDYRCIYLRSADASPWNLAYVVILSLSRFIIQMIMVQSLCLAKVCVPEPRFPHYKMRDCKIQR